MLLNQVSYIAFFNAFILRNNLPSDKLAKSFGMRHSITTYADQGLKMRDTFAFGCFDIKVRLGTRREI
jgi:hypothetical protein